MALSEVRELDQEAMGPTPEETAAIKQAMADVEADRFPQVVRALRNPNFRLFWSGTFLSNIGTWMQNVAQGWVTRPYIDRCNYAG
jgi:hypothetical protein